MEVKVAGALEQPEGSFRSGRLLEVSDVSVRFGGIVALDGVSFGVDAGQIAGLIGPNGAGKTTLFNCLSRLYEANSGSVSFDGHALLQMPRHRIAALGIGRTFQNVALFARMSVLDNVMVGCHCRTSSGFFANALRLPGVAAEQRRTTEKARELVHFVGLDALADTPVAALPFPMQKRVELARALAAEPKLLLLDEPAAGPQSRRGRRARPPDPRHPRSAAHDGASGRAPHEPGDEHLRQGRGAQLRPQDRRRHAGRGARASGSDPGLPGYRSMSAPGRSQALIPECEARRVQ